jgi:uncharacterized protein (DUF2236 family)
VAACTFGSVPQALHISTIVRAMHTRVVGTLDDGRRFAASDPELLAWVSMTFTDSLLATDQAFAAHPVDAATADRFVLEQSRIGALLDPRVDLPAFVDDPEAQDALRAWDVELPLLDEGLLPTDVASLRTCLARYDNVLERGVHAEEALTFLRDPGLPGFAMPAYRAMQVGAVATLPRQIRDQLGFGWVRGPVASAARRQTGALLTGMRLGTGSSPARRSAERRVRATG